MAHTADDMDEDVRFPPPPSRIVGRVMTWQPIETAPKDGTQVLLYRASERQVYVARWTHSEEIGPVWCTPDATMIFRASHWMPLPEPPQEK